MNKNNLVYYFAFPLATITNIIWAGTMGSIHNKIDCSDATNISYVLIAILIISVALFFWKKQPMQKPWKVVIPIIVIVISLITTIMIITLTMSICSRVIGVSEKPVIYLYPEVNSNISVYVDLKDGTISESIPQYDNGWNVFVTEDGRIEGEYDYLFYETTMTKLDLPDDGWIIAGDSIGAWCDEYLPKLGLIDHESKDFKEYWVNRLPQSDFYEVRMLSREYLDSKWTLHVVPEPDTTIRLMFSFRPLSDKHEIQEPDIITPIREGFTVVEWGGILLD